MDTRRAAPPRGAAPTLPRRPRLKRTIEPFTASDGNLYLLRPGAGSDCVLRQPSTAVHDLIGLLDGSRTLAALHTALQSAGHPVDLDALTNAVADLQARDLVEDADTPPPPQAERLDRQLAYFADAAPPGQDATDLQHRLAAAHVVIIGVGGLGCWTASGLACLGIGALTLVDDDTVALSNLNRQILFTPRDLGQPKVHAAARALRDFAPDLTVDPRPRRVNSAADVAALATDATFVVATADWPPHAVTRWINRGCLTTATPCIAAGQVPPLIRVGPTVLPGHSACLECHEQHIRDRHPLYNELADHRDHRPAYAATLGPASGIVGSLIATEILHAITDIARPPTVGATVMVNLRTLEFDRRAIEPHPQCPACGS